MAQSFDAEGAKVWVVDNNADALAQCPDHWRKSCLDVTDESSVSSLFEELVTEWGSVDTLCSNAGIAGPGNPIEDVALVDWRACVSVSLEGAFLFAKYAAPLMKAQRSGAIIVTSSTAGIFGFAILALRRGEMGIIGLTKPWLSNLALQHSGHAICLVRSKERMTFGNGRHKGKPLKRSWRNTQWCVMEN